VTASTRFFNTVDDMADAAVDRIMLGLETAADDGRHYLLGCPGGRTPRPVYEALGRRAAEIGLDCSVLVVVMMDDYLDPDAGSPTLVKQGLHYSCRRFAEREIRQVVNGGLPQSRRLPTEQVWFPDPLDPASYDQRIAAVGGVDLFLVASGASDGHVAFCGPGAAIDGETSVVELAPRTRIDNMITFPDFDHLDDVPTHGVSVGLGTIRQLSRSVLLLLHGADKQQSARRAAGGHYQPDWPATFIHQCRQAEIWIDEAAKGAD
jgi:glucosamine-6-phosphate deaminase